jgi:carbon-monoxide dehydrogenase medium subunit
MWRHYYSVKSVEEALRILSENGDRARIIAGGTDLLLEMERGIRPKIDTLIDITRIPGLNQITQKGDQIHLGALVTHNHCVQSELIRARAVPLAQAAWEVGAPQIRNRGTVAGNIITASPANDTIPPLMALGAKVKLKSITGQRVIPLEDFYTGVRRTEMQSDEMLVDISFPAMKSNQKGAFYKLGLRRAQVISVVNAAAVLTYCEDSSYETTKRNLSDVKITLGSVAPTVVFARNAQEYLKENGINRTAIKEASIAARESAHPIDDIRGSALYRDEMVRVCVSRVLRSIHKEGENIFLPSSPVLLADFSYRKSGLFKSIYHTSGTPIVTNINGNGYTIKTGQNKTLLRLLREDAGLIGTKEGCAEGECGACTVFLDGMAVMSCLVPAVRAHGAEITTIEGIAVDDQLHPIQQAFIDEGAVQCGYCTPGFIMSGVKLLEEKPNPSYDDVRQSITGNLCRCTGYYKIISAIERAGVYQG